MQLELVDPDQAFVDFGIVSVGSDVTKSIPIINKSKKPITFQLLPSNKDQFLKNSLSFTPDSDKDFVTLKPKETKNIDIRYNPKIRMPTFVLDIVV